MATSETGRDWRRIFIEIRYPQWGAALAWRAFARGLPILWNEIFGAELSAETARAAATILRSVLAYPLVLEQAYRERHAKAADPSAAVLFEQRPFAALFKQAGAAHSRLGSSAILDALLAMLVFGGNAPTRAALELVAEMTRQLESRPPRELSDAWTAAIEDDLHALEPMDEENPGDLRAHLERPLWPNDTAPRTLPDWFHALVRQIEDVTTPSEGNVLIELLRSFDEHAFETLPWTQLSTLLQQPTSAPLSPDESLRLEALGDDRRRLAILLARLALDDRSRLELVTAPSAAGLREAMSRGGLTRTDFLTLEADLERKQPDFTPNEVWLAWVRVVHRTGLDNIRAEILSWLTT